MRNEDLAFGIILIFLGVILIVTGISIFIVNLFNVVETYGDPIKIVKGDCFDRNYNKINEVTCDVREDEFSHVAVLTLMGLMIFAIGFFPVLFGWAIVTADRRSRK